MNTVHLLAIGGVALLTLNNPTLALLDNNTLAGTDPFTLDNPTSGRLNENPLTAAGYAWNTGTVMWDGGYSDMPYMVTMPNGTLLSTLTVSDAVEGAATQHVIVLSSTDHGATWATLTELEPADGPEASWAMPWLAPSGRLYVFYTYNAADIRFIPDNDGVGGEDRVDAIGVLAYRSSTDNGATWGERRTVDLPVSAIDLRNPFDGLHQQFWLSGHVVTRNNVGYLGLSKMGVADNGYLYSDTEAFIVAVDEVSPGVVSANVSAPIISTDPVTEEPSPVVFEDGTINVAFRTEDGFVGEAWSTDGGVTWTIDRARDTAGDPIPQPRAKAAQFVLPDGRLLLWGHNSAPTTARGWGPRNPVIYRIGVRVGPRVVWGEPQTLLSDDNPATAISYPSLIVVGDEVLVAATDKATARVFRVPLTELG